MTDRSPSGKGSPPSLSGRETEIIGLIAAGHTNARIAAHLFLAEKTVKNHVNNIYAKLGAVSRSDAISRWQGEAVEIAPGRRRPTRP